MIRALLLGLVLFAPAMAGAAERRDRGPQVINFEDDTIQGDLTKPDGEYVEARKKVNHTNLIRIREEFKDKVLQSVSDL
ncbi:MAG: adventurous gliding motility protein CglF [Deltaproteobacteria bacterium]|nr:adventurous gliding motility protein CglF [Deltaproteobacteria bacterium]